MSSVTVQPSHRLPFGHIGHVASSSAQTHHGRRAWMRMSLAVLVAVLGNALIIWMLYSLNTMSMPAMQSPSPVMTVMLNRPQQRVQEHEPQPQQEIQPQVLTVNLDIPDPTPPQPLLMALDLSMAMPQMSSVLVSVMTPPTQSPVVKAAPQSKSTPAPAMPQTMQSDQVDTPPAELAGNPTPVYPDRELQRRRTGDVTLKLLINERGRVEQVQLLEHNGSSQFVDVVMQVIQQYRFTPARHQGRIVKVWGIKTIRFEIGD